MNYFQNLYLCDFQQQVAKEFFQDISCELLSKFVSFWFPTTGFPQIMDLHVLWITFKIFISMISNNLYEQILCWIWVVNYFSKFVSLWLPTTSYKSLKEELELWITFKICTFVISNNNKQHLNWIYLVVNYFQNLYLCDSQQPKRKRLFLNVCCELLSKFVSLWLPTTFGDINTISPLLWITFKICIFVIFNKDWYRSITELRVVSYFQNLYLCDCKQQATDLIPI